jgi:DNA-binding NarL/FixJ family response regulator
MTLGEHTSPAVVVVEDDLALLAFLVTRLDYEDDLRVVGYATDAAEALRLCETLTPDIVLSDVDLPDLNGVELVGRLRAMLPTSALVLYTAACSARLEREARLNGADECLDKSVAPSQVIASLRSSLSARREVEVVQPLAAGQQ